MKQKSFLIIDKNGIKAVRKTKPALEWDEIACEVSISVPDELFKRPMLRAEIEVKDIPLIEFDPKVIIDSKELIEQQTGAKIEFEVIYTPEDDKKK